MFILGLLLRCPAPMPEMPETDSTADLGQEEPTPLTGDPPPEQGEPPVDYRAEMMKHAFRPCFLSINGKIGLAKRLGTERALSFMLELQKEKIEAGVKAMVPLLDGKDFEQRLAIYELGLKSCTGLVP